MGSGNSGGTTLEVIRAQQPVNTGSTAVGQQRGDLSTSSSSSADRRVTVTTVSNSSSSPKIVGHPSRSHCLDPSVTGVWEIQDAGAVGLYEGWQPMDDASSCRLEEAFVKGKKECQVVQAGKLATVNFETLKKVGAGGTSAVRRLDTLSRSGPAARSGSSLNLIGAPRNLSTKFSDPFLDASEAYPSGNEFIAEDEIDSLSPVAGVSSSSSAAFSGVARGTLISTVKAHEEAIYTIAVHPSGEQVLTGARDGTVKLWESTTGYVRKEFEPVAGQVISVALSRSKNLAAAGADDEKVRLYNLNTETSIGVFARHEHKVYGVYFTGDNRSLLSASMDGTLCLWDLTTQKLSRRVVAHAEPIFAAAVAPLSPYLCLSASDDKTCKVHDLRMPEGETVVQVLVGHDRTLWGCDIRYDEHEVVTCGMDKGVFLWDLRVATTTSGGDGGTSSTGSTHSSTAAKNNSSASAPEKSAQFLRDISTHTKAVHWVEYMPSGDSVLSSSRDFTWKLTCAKTGRVSLSSCGHKGNVFRVTYNTVANKVYTCSSDRTVKVWEMPASCTESTACFDDCPSPPPQRKSSSARLHES